MKNGLPTTWTAARLDDTCHIEMGQSPPSTTYNQEENGLPFFQGKAEFTDLYPVVRKWCSKPSKLARKDDILLSVRAPVGPTNLAHSECCIGRGLAALSPQPGVSNRYILHAIRRFEADLAKLGSGSTFEAISGQDVREFTIPIAPSSEQIRIVAKLEELFSDLDAGVAALDRARANLKRYRAAVLKAAVEGKLTEQWRKDHPDVEPGSKLLERILAERRKEWEEAQLAKYAAAGKRSSTGWTSTYPVPRTIDHSSLPELPAGWCWSSLGQCFKVAVGATPSRKVSEYWNGDIPWVSSGEVQFCKIYQTRERITPAGLKNSSTQINPAGSVLLGMIGEGKTRGQAAILEIDACNNQNCAAIWVSETPIPVRFVYYWLYSRYELTRAIGSGNNQPALNKTLVEDIPIPLPPTEEQVEIVNQLDERLSAVEFATAGIEKGLTRALRLRQAILKRAFEGKLVPQDTNDEPASVLLERIRAARAASAPPTRNGRGKRIRAA